MIVTSKEDQTFYISEDIGEENSIINIRKDSLNIFMSYDTHDIILFLYTASLLLFCDIRSGSSRIRFDIFFNTIRIVENNSCGINSFYTCKNNKKIF